MWFSEAMNSSWHFECAKLHFRYSLIQQSLPLSQNTVSYTEKVPIFRKTGTQNQTL